MITKEEFNKLYDDNITKKEFDSIINKIDIRFIEIVKSMKIVGHDGWFDYANCGVGRDESKGYFNHIEYKENIGIGGEYLKFPDGLDAQIPTRWLWEENWKEEYKEKIEKGKKWMEEYNNKILCEKEKILNIRKTIKSKLTKEELKYIIWAED